MFISCEPLPDVPCNKHVEWLAANETKRTIVVDYVDYHYTQIDSVMRFHRIQQSPYKTFITQERLHVQFLLEGRTEMKLYMLIRGTDPTPDGCTDTAISNGTELITYIYNLTDTTKYDLYWELDGYAGNLSFTSLEWHYDPETDTNYTYCYLTIDSSALAAMQKDYSMLEQFADYYNGKQ